MTVAADVPSSFRATRTAGSGNAAEPTSTVRADDGGSGGGTIQDGVLRPGADGGDAAHIGAASWWWPPSWFHHTDRNTDVTLPGGVDAEVSDGHKIAKVQTLDDIDAASSRGDAQKAVHETNLSHPSSIAVRNAMQAAKDLGIDTASHRMNVVTDIRHDAWLSPAALQDGSTPTMLVPDQNVMKTIVAKLRDTGGDAAVAAQGLAGKQFTDELLPEDVALHETEHLRQFAADTNGPDKLTADERRAQHEQVHDAIALSPLEQSEREHLDASNLTDAGITDKVATGAIQEGMADTVAMTHTRDWKMGEGYFVGGDGAVRDINTTRAQDDFAGAFDDYRPIQQAIEGMHTAEHAAFLDAQQVAALEAKGSHLSNADKAALKDAKDAETTHLEQYTTASQPIKGDEHLAGTIIPRTFRELQQVAGWDQTRQLADAVGTDSALWTDADFGKTVDSMRRHANELDPSGKLRGQVDAALAKTHLDEASKTVIAAPTPQAGSSANAAEHDEHEHEAQAPVTPSRTTERDEQVPHGRGGRAVAI